MWARSICKDNGMDEIKLVLVSNYIVLIIEYRIQVEDSPQTFIKITVRGRRLIQSRKILMFWP